jgi:hypothetical protein
VRIAWVKPDGLLKQPHFGRDIVLSYSYRSASIGSRRAALCAG